MGFVVFLLYILHQSHITYPHVTRRSAVFEPLIAPAQPRANSIAFIQKTALSNYSIHNGNQSSCRFETPRIPCECILVVSDTYTLEENDVQIAMFSVGPPNIRITVPLRHEMLQELEVEITSKLCIAEEFRVELLYRAFEMLPPESWSVISYTSVLLHASSTNISFPCENFADSGLYSIRIVSLHGYSVESDNQILVNETSKASLQLRNDSIFPHCVKDLSLQWETPKCDSAVLSYHIRVMAIPERESEHSHRSHYIEDVSLSPGQTTLNIGCFLFDIFYEKYCFELISINAESAMYHLWRWTCVSTEPAPRIDVKWSNWSPWSECSATCGESIQKRQRYCENAKPYPDKGCEGDLYETRSCSLPECPDVGSKGANLGNCTCGCEMVGPSGFFFATAANADLCGGNQTWSMAINNQSVVTDFKISADVDAQGKLFFFVGAPYKELVWFSGSNQEQAFTLPVDRPIFVVLWFKGNGSTLENRGGFYVAYSMREVQQQLPTRPTPSCHPLCQETLIIGCLAVLFILIIFIPPVVCASMTQKLRRYSLHEPSLVDKEEECGVMARSGTTDCTQMSEEKSAGLAHRSVGVQLSVQSTPRILQTTRFPPESPFPCGASSISTSNDLEYDYYDGTTIPGSLLAPINDVDNSLLSEINQLISQSALFSNPVEGVETNGTNGHL
ncbi:hypothetical protein V3C99_002286 [Haemonchus contortus]